MKEDKKLLAMAEQFLDEMIEGEREEKGDYELFTRRFDKKTLKAFGPSRFKKEMMCIKNETLITLGIHLRDDVYYVNEIMYR